jgi:cytochrome P450/NADPH-cytochrome P450 reductase
MDSGASDSLPIPQPPAHLFVGNVSEIDPNDAPGSFQRLAEIYGEAYQLDLPGRKGKVVVMSSYDTINDCCDGARFEKPINATLEEVRALTGDGLFTAYPGEKVRTMCFFRSTRILTRDCRPGESPIVYLCRCLAQWVFVRCLTI